MTDREDPWATRRAGLRRSLQRARQFQQDLDHGLVKNAAALAQREGLTRARISQLLRLPRLTHAILDELDDVKVHGPAPRECHLRKLSDIQPDDAQLAAYREHCGEESRKLRGRKTKPRRVVGRRGFTHLFDRARRYHQAVASKEVASIAALGRAEGVSGSRVGQIMVLLYLAPDIIEQVENAQKALPGLTERKLRRIARIRDHEQQRREFAELLARGKTTRR